MKKFSLLLLFILMTGSLVILSCKINDREDTQTTVCTTENYTNFGDIFEARDVVMSCSKVEKLPDDAIFSEIKSSVKAATGRQSRYYSALNEKQKVIYNALNSQITTYPTNAAYVNGVYLSELTKKEINDAVFSWFFANPEAFWITSTIRYTCDSSTGEITAIYFRSYEVDSHQFENKVNEIINQVLLCQGEYQRLHKIQEIICNENVYDYDLANNIDFNQTTYSAIATGKTVCAGYGRAAALIANRIGIDVESVVTEKHLFNYYFNEEDKPYLMDLCWDDGPDGKSVNYNYFLIGKKTLSKIDKSTHHTNIEFNVFPKLSDDDYPVPTEKPTEAPTERPTEAPTERPTEAPTERPTEAPTERPTEAPTERPTEAPTERPTESPTERPTEAPTERPTEAPTERPTEAPTETEPENETEPVKETKPVFIQGYWYKDGIFRRDYDSIVEAYTLNGGFGDILFNTAEFNDPRGMLSYAITFDENVYFEIPICRTDDSAYVGLVLISKGAEFKIVAFDAVSREISYISSTELLDISGYEHKSITYTFAYPKEAERGQYITNVVDVTADGHATFYDPEFEYGLTICFSDGTYEEKINAYGEEVYTFGVKANNSCFIGHSLYNLGIGLRESDGEYKFTVSEEICPYILTVDETEYFLFVEGGRAFMLKKY